MVLFFAEFVRKGLPEHPIGGRIGRIRVHVFWEGLMDDVRYSVSVPAMIPEAGEYK